MEDLLEVLRVQRHNFLNHLQVISGLLQLKKHDRIMDYIIQIGDEYNQDSLVGRLEVPEIVVAILSSDLAAGKQGIKINKRITTGLEKGIAKAEEAADILKQLLKLVISVVWNADSEKQEIELDIKEEAAKYAFRLKLPCSVIEEEFRNEFEALKTKVLILDKDIEVEYEKGLQVLTLKIPVYDNNTDK